MNKLVYALIAVFVINTVSIDSPYCTDYSVDSASIEYTPAEYSSTHSHFLKLGAFYQAAERIPFWIRSYKSKYPGDYFQEPKGADVVKLTENEINLVRNTVKSFIRPAYYRDDIFNKMTGFEYELQSGKVHRREFYVRYLNADTIFVISGLVDKFVSFYKAVPFTKRLSSNEVKTDVSKYLMSSESYNFQEFTHDELKDLYFMESIDYKSKSRIRNYSLVKYEYISNSNKRDEKHYNLIEITKFLDKEVMP